MTKEEFVGLIRKAVRDKVKSGKLALPGKGEVTIPSKFPTVEETLVKLLTDQYPLFVQDILWIAPRPTTFKVVFKNNQSMLMVKTDTDWMVQIEGKKYYMPSLQDEQRAAEAIARVLGYGQAKGEAGETAPPAGEGGTATPLPPAEETPPFEAPEETPPAV